MASNITERLAEWVAEMDFPRIPGEVLVVAKRAILDYLGVSLAGSNQDAPKLATEYARALGGVLEATAIGQRLRAPVELAAWVNGISGHALDFDDCSAESSGYPFHLSVPVLPAVLALGEKCRASGKDALTAYVAGVETEMRVASAIGYRNSEAGWHCTAALGVIGATAAAAKILRLDVPRTRMALGIAASMSGGLRLNFGTMTKPLHAGNAARSGVMAATLAGNGFTACDSIMEGPLGFYKMLGGSEGQANGAQDAEIRWGIVSPGIGFKPYPSCRGTHSSIDAILSLKNEHKLSASDIEHITFTASPRQLQSLRYHRPSSPSEALFSAEFCLAMALLEGKVSLEQFSEPRIKDPSVQALLDRITYRSPAGWASKNKLEGEVTVRLHSGTEYTCRITIPKGDPVNPMSAEELEKKFRHCAGLVLSPGDIEKAASLVEHLESLDNITALMNILA